MRPETREWVAKAEDDFRTAAHLADESEPYHDQVCFHCQQSAEKYLKARLEEAGQRTPKTHDLEDLLDALLHIEPLWSALRPALKFLTDYAVDFRYPGNEADAQAAKTARKYAKAVRKEARLSLGLKA